MKTIRLPRLTLVVFLLWAGEPTGKPLHPAAYSSVIGVAALGPDGGRWEKSNDG
jgi:hypothetical protein